MGMEEGGQGGSSAEPVHGIWGVKVAAWGQKRGIERLGRVEEHCLRGATSWGGERVEYRGGIASCPDWTC